MAKLREGVLARGLSGKAGSVVFVRNPAGGTTIRERNTPSDPKSPAQTEWRALVKRASGLWRTLTLDEAVAWRDYAFETAGLEPGSTPNAAGRFMALTAKFWQFDPDADPPRLPPSQAFTGDGIGIQASGIGERGPGTGYRDTGAGPRKSEVRSSVRTLNPSPQSLTPGVLFTASGPNSEGVATELLLQPLASPICRPQTGKDRHKGFATFTAGSLEAVVAAEPGAYATSVRFVNTATGQVSALVRVGSLTVEG